MARADSTWHKESDVSTSVMFAAALVNFGFKVVDVSSSCIEGIYAYEVRRSYGAKIRRGSSGGRFIQFHKLGTTVLNGDAIVATFSCVSGCL